MKTALEHFNSASDIHHNDKLAYVEWELSCLIAVLKESPSSLPLNILIQELQVIVENATL